MTAAEGTLAHSDDDADVRDEIALYFATNAGLAT